MDYSLPVAKRTRRGQELYWKEFYENWKKNRTGDKVSVSHPERYVKEKNAQRQKSIHGSKKSSPGSSVEYTYVHDSDESEEEARAYASLDVSDEAEEANAKPPTRSKHNKRLGKRNSSNGSKKCRSGCSIKSESIEVSDHGEKTTAGPSTGAKTCQKMLGKQKSSSGSKIWRSRCSLNFESIDDSDDGEEAAAAPSRGAKREKKVGKRKSCEGSTKWRSNCSMDSESINDSDDGEGATAGPSRGAKREKKVGKRKSSGGSRKRRSGCSMDFESINVSDGGELPSVEIIGEDSCGENDNDGMDSIDIQSAGSKNGKTSECGPLDLEDSDSDVVYLGEEGVGEGGGGGGGGGDFVSDSSYETDTLLSSEEESAHSDDEDYDPEKSESSEFSKESSSSGGDGQQSDESDGEVNIQRTDKRDAKVKKLENVNERERKKGSRKARKRESVEDNVEVIKVHNIDGREVKEGSRKEGKGKSVKGGVEVKKWQHVGKQENKGHMEKLTNRQSMWETKHCNVLNVLVDSIYEKEEVLQEGSDTLGNEALKDERNPPVAQVTTLPLKFTFGSTSTQPSVPKKQEMDPEEKELWDYLDFDLKSCEIGSTESHEVENQDPLPTVCEENAAALCKRGIHQLMLDEEIGSRCRFCSYLDQEIKYIVPEFVKYPCERFGARVYEPDNPSIFDELQSLDYGSDPHSGCSSHVHAEGTVWDFIPGVQSSMYSHQREGFEFIWNHIAGGIHVEELKRRSSDYSGNGCIISHAPGTGKTRLTIVFLQTYLKLFPKCRPLLIAPRSMLLTWEEEFKKWEFDIPFHNLNNTELSGEENEAAVDLMMKIDGPKSINRVNNSRMLKLYSWAKERSILGISYQLFEKLSGADHSGAEKKGLAEVMRDILVEFPGLVVFDEGHTPRNNKSHIWKALSEIKTKKRILLSGTPFQNNFQELFNTICVVRPMFAASIDSAKFTGDFLRSRARKGNVEKWQWTSVANCSEKVAAEKEQHATEVKEKIAPFVNVYKGSVLQDSLPGLRNSVVVLHPMQLQKKFHQRIQGVKEQFQYEHLEAINSIHPSLLLHEDAFSGDWDRLKELKLNPDAGVKTKFLMELIRLSDALNERVLVFCQYISPLTLARDLLRSQFHWSEGEEVLYMDGKCDMKQRQSSMKIFNDPSSKAKVLLASTKGCCEGISLVGASRVVLLDVTWNPSVERQAISRAYRLGQKKIVYVYHLLMDGTNEEHKYRRQVDKSRLSELVFSDSDRNDSLEKKIRAVSEDKILEEMAQHEKLKHIFESIALLHEDIYFEQLGLSTFG
ncbi:unnamed protein product [Malus baccata var. baccata]